MSAGETFAKGQAETLRWFEVFDRQIRSGASAQTAADVADRIVGKRWNALDLGFAEQFATGGVMGLGSMLKKVFKVAAPIAASFIPGIGGMASTALSKIGTKAIAGTVLKQTLASKAKDVLVSRVLPGVGKIASKAAKLGKQASKVAGVAAGVGAGAGLGSAIGGKVMRGGESLDVTFLDEEGMIVKTRGRRRSGRKRVTRKSRRSSPIRRRASRTRRRAPARRAAPRRASRARGTPKQRAARRRFVKRFAKRSRRRR